ncbi:MULTISPECIES: hypothetical protein [Halostella]|uniref:hypothetical protein n=1 Tax=Halostella TaxID=1843185 RepID=UPI0019638BE7|nr:MULTISPECIES: hypothetical protein [Halostella]
MAVSGGLSRWTRCFAVASALSMVALQAAFLGDPSLRTVAVVGLLGAALPMVFGMAYLLLPSYVGRTLSARRLPGVHFALAYAGVGLLAGDSVFELGGPVTAVGATLWSAGVGIFVWTLLRTVLPAIAADPEVVLRAGERPQRSTRLGTVAIPVAVGYLVVGTVALLSATPPFPDPIGATLPMVVHYYGTGFAALLIFALGTRLLTGFFHVTPPSALSRTVLCCGAVAPAVLSAAFWRPPWFLVGAGLELVAMAGYAALVAVVAYRTDRRRVGLYGIGLGALGGVAAVGVAAVGALGIETGLAVAVHVPLVLDGFLLLTILGYAYQFFPVTAGGFPGATERVALTTILAL